MFSHLPQLSQILFGSRSHVSHSMQPMHSLSYNTHICPCGLFSSAIHTSTSRYGSVSILLYTIIFKIQAKIHEHLFAILFLLCYNTFRR